MEGKWIYDFGGTLCSLCGGFILPSVQAGVFCILILCLIHEGVFRPFLHHHKDAVFSLYFPPIISRLCFSASLFPLQSSCLLSCREMLLKMLQQKKQRNRYWRGNKVICSLSLAGDRRGEERREDEGEMRSEEEKKELGTGEAGINNLTKKAEQS